jgi:hypothetical protein
VTDAAWDAFVRAVSSRPIRDVSKGGGVGSFDLRPRRLGELGVMVNMRRSERGAWVGDLLPRYAGLGASVSQQLEVFTKSMVKYDADLLAGLVRPESASRMSRSGCLAILHCGGSGALRRWPEGAFVSTRALFERVNDIF